MDSRSSGPDRFLEVRSDQQHGKAVRLARVIASGRPTLMVPLDDSLIFGPTGRFTATADLVKELVESGVDSFLAFPGTLQSVDPAARVGRIVNLSASTVRHNHTRKVLFSGIERAVALGADAVAVHLNVSSQFESEMIVNLGTIVQAASQVGLPVLAISYPRSETASGDENYLELKTTRPEEYSTLVAHACRVAHELGADIIKTQYTGTPETFARVVAAVRPTPVIVAGGPVISGAALIEMAAGAVQAGGSGVSFGRNIHQRTDGTSELLAALRQFFAGTLELSAAQALVSGY